MNNFEKIMNNKNYWDNLNIDKILEENGDTNSIKQKYMSSLKTDNKNSMKIHMSKRYNRKYINAVKHKLKDKRIVYQKARLFSKIDYFKKDLVLKNVVFLEKETLIKTKEEKATIIITPEDIYMEINIFDCTMTISGLFEIIENNLWYTIISLDKKINKTFFKFSVAKIIRKKRYDLIFEKEVVLSRSNSYLNKNLSGKIYFYNKLVKNGYIDNIYVAWPKKINDSWWFEETQINFRKQEQKFLDQIEEDYYEE